MRSLWHLSRHLTARADDNHAAPPQRPRRESTSLFPSAAVQARVRFLAYHRIKPHVPPLVRAPVNSFEFHRCRRTPQVGCLMLSLSRGTPGAPQRASIVYRADYQGIYSCSIPALSSFSVSYAPASCLRNRGSSSYLSISPLHDEFRRRCAHSSGAVRAAVQTLGAYISQHAYLTAYAPFKPNKSG